MSGASFPVRVYYEDTDAGGVVYFANYLRFMERARTEWLRHLGFDQSKLREDCGIVFVVRRVSADYQRPARLDDALTVQSGLVRLTRVSMFFEQRIHRAGEVLVEARSEVVCVNATTLRPSRMPDSLMQSLRAVAHSDYSSGYSP